MPSTGSLVWTGAVGAGTKSSGAAPNAVASGWEPVWPLGEPGQPALAASWDSHRFLRLPGLGQCRGTAGPGVCSSCDFLLRQGTLVTVCFLQGRPVPVRVCVPATTSPVGPLPGPGCTSGSLLAALSMARQGGGCFCR